MENNTMGLCQSLIDTLDNEYHPYEFTNEQEQKAYDLFEIFKEASPVKVVINNRYRRYLGEYITNLETGLSTINIKVRDQNYVSILTTLLHEMAHSMLHRPLWDEKVSKRREETEAELTAATVMHALGFETTTYLPYIKNYGERPDAWSINRIAKTATRILELLED